MIGRVEINDLEYPRGQKYFHPGDETVFGEVILPKNATLWLHSHRKTAKYDIIIAIEPLELFAGLKLMIWSTPGVKAGIRGLPRLKNQGFLFFSHTSSQMYY